MVIPDQTALVVRAIGDVQSILLAQKQLKEIEVPVVGEMQQGLNQLKVVYHWFSP